MNQSFKSGTPERRTPKWIAFGFLGAFATSVLTVIYTGLNVQDHGAPFDAGFRSVTLIVGEVRTIDLFFESEEAVPDAILEVTLPEMVDFARDADIQQARTPVAMPVGSTTFSIDIQATEVGRDYLRTRIIKDLPIDAYRVFVTVEEE
jgi:hypothetical protein